MTILCPVCGFLSENLTTHVKTHGYTPLEFKKTFGLKWLRSDRLRKSQSDFMRKSSPTFGGHSDEALNSMRTNRKGKGFGVAGKYVRTGEIRSKISRGVSEAHFRGDFTRKGHGSYVPTTKAVRGEIWARSSWEARMIRVLDAHPQVWSITPEPMSIPYSFEGIVHRYIPDFLVVLSGNVHEIWEVKGDFLEKDPKTQAKKRVLNDYVLSQNMNACWVNSWALIRMEMQVGIRPWLGAGAPWVVVGRDDILPTVGVL